LNNLDDHGVIKSFRNERQYSKTSIGIFAGAAVGYFLGSWIIGLLLEGFLGLVADATPSNVPLDESDSSNQGPL